MSVRFFARVVIAPALLLALCGRADAAAAPIAANIRHAARTSSGLEGFADFVIDLDDNSFSIEDDDDQEEDEGGKASSSQATLCIAPPCGLKMEAVPVNDARAAPVPWSMRLKGPNYEV